MSMAEERKDLVLAHLSWPEVKELLPGIEMVLVPVGSNEQHGPNGTLETDTALVYAVCRRVSEELYPQVLVAPPIPWGISFHHMEFPGTISLEMETLKYLLYDVVNSLHRHGLQRFLLVNGHGGNQNLVNVATWKIKEGLKVPFIGACSYFGMGLGAPVGHAGKVEMSLAMYLAPHAVKEDQFTDGDMTGYENRVPNVSMPLQMVQRSRNGTLGPIAGASREYGQELGEAAVDGLKRAIEMILEGGYTVWP
jgi:creatinine amidohydrolase